MGGEKVVDEGDQDGLFIISVYFTFTFPSPFSRVPDPSRSQPRKPARSFPLIDPTIPDQRPSFIAVPLLTASPLLLLAPPLFPVDRYTHTHARPLLG